MCDAAKADKARLEYLEVEVVKQTNRANASELSEAGLLDRVRQLEVRRECQPPLTGMSSCWWTLVVESQSPQTAYQQIELPPCISASLVHLHNPEPNRRPLRSRDKRRPCLGSGEL